MKGFMESLRVMLGAEPKRVPKEQQTPAAQKIHFVKKGEKFDPEKAALEHAEYKNNKWRNRRWITLIIINLLFVVSYQFDVQLIEGALTASRVVGFHMADLNSALQVVLAYKVMLINLVIGTVTVLILWILFGGRAFCSWVCPYHLLAEWSEKVHLWLAAKGIVKDHPFHRRLRTVFYVIFALLALVTGYTVYEWISPTGIVSRALIYGPGLAMAWVVALLAFEVLYSRRFWCRYACPIGLTYGFVGLFTPVRVNYTLEHCQHEGECIKVCLVPHVLECVKKGRAYDVQIPVGADCTRCGLCVDKCPTGALRFDIKGLSKIL